MPRRGEGRFRDSWIVGGIIEAAIRLDGVRKNVYHATMRIYLDICSIQRPLDDQSQLCIATETEAILGILDLVERSELTLLKSAAHAIETQQNPYPDRKDHALAVLSLASHYLATTSEVTERAKTFAGAEIKRLDALHLALAVEGEADFFCTTDDKLLHCGRKADTKETLVVSPLELVDHVDQSRSQS